MFSPDKKDLNRPYSIIARLTFGYTLLATVILSTIAFFLYYALVQNIQNKDLRFLVDKNLHLRKILKDTHHAHNVLKQEVNEGGGYQFHKFYIRILDAKGSLVMVTKEGSSFIAELPFPAPHEEGEDPWKFEKHKSINGKMFLLMSVWAKSKNYPEGRVLLNTAIDITEEQELLNDYQNVLLVAIACGVLFSLVLAIIVARHGLRPLKHISDAIQQVRVSRLHERLDPRQWPPELVQLVENFDKMLDRLEDSVNRISRFSSDIAHDLRTPIQTLRGESEIMLIADRTIEEYQENLTSSLEEYDRLTHLIESLLFIERAENTDMELKQTTFDIKTKVDKIISFYEALIELKAITVVFNGTGQVNADPPLFERAIINIISNAVKYTKNGGHIKFYVATKNDQTVSLSVNNDGPAIEPEDLEHLFDRFYRADSAKKVDHNGLGLGLSIAKSIMDLHGGNIQAQSNAITGTTFTLNFPPK